MARLITVLNRSRGGAVVLRAKRCSSFLCRLMGLSLRRALPDGVGLILIEPREARIATSVHMFGMRFDIGVLWVNNMGTVVDGRWARPWRIYLPAAPARYMVEGAPEILERAGIGDTLEFVDDDAA